MTELVYIFNDKYEFGFVNGIFTHCPLKDTTQAFIKDNKNNLEFNYIYTTHTLLFLVRVSF